MPNQLIRFVRKLPARLQNSFARKIASSFSPQVIAEFWNVATCPAGVNGLGLSNDEVMREVNAIERLLTLLPDNPAIYVAWKEVVREHQVQGVKVFDARLVATMHVYGVETILTFNLADFKRYSHINATHPASVVA